MFGGGISNDMARESFSANSASAPPPQSKEEIAEQEQVASRTVQVAVASSILLYLCTRSTHPT